MSQKVAVIIGATGGIGSALARQLAADGWGLTLCARNAEKLEALATETGAAWAAADATKSADVANLFREAAEHHGSVTAAVNCVGSILLKPAHLTTDAEWEETILLNLTSAFYTVREAAKVMRRGGGAIALCSSAAAQIGLANHEAIAAAKAGVIGLARSAAATYAASRIRVNAVAPGLVDTPMAARIVGNEAALKVSLAMHPLGRIGQPADVASALAWFIDPRQSWVTGQVIGVEGGLASLKNH